MVVGGGGWEVAAAIVALARAPPVPCTSFGIPRSMCVPIQSLSSRRRALYAYTRPAFALAAPAIAVAADWLSPAPLNAAERPAIGAVDRACLAPLAAAGGFGALSVLRRRGGLGWLAHAHERYAWAAAFGGMGLAAAAWCTQSIEQHPLMIGPSAACALVATAGERLGGAVGRTACLPAATAAIFASAWSFSHGDSRPERLVQGSALLLLPLLHLCPAVYTLTGNSLLSLSWRVGTVLRASDASAVHKCGGACMSVAVMLLLMCTRRCGTSITITWEQSHPRNHGCTRQVNRCRRV